MLNKEIRELFQKLQDAKNLKLEIENLKLNFPEFKPSIELTFDPPWSHEMISEEGLEFLNK